MREEDLCYVHAISRKELFIGSHKRDLSNRSRCLLSRYTLRPLFHAETTHTGRHCSGGYEHDLFPILVQRCQAPRQRSKTIALDSVRSRKRTAADLDDNPMGATKNSRFLS